MDEESEPHSHPRVIVHRILRSSVFIAHNQTPSKQASRARPSRMSRSPQLSLSGCSSLFSLSSTSTSRDNDSAAAAPVPVPLSLHPLLPPRPPGPLLSLSIGGGGDEEEEYLQLGGLDLQLMGGGGGGGGGGDDDDERKTVRMMKNRESALRSRARKRAYVQELEKEVRRLVNENLKLKRQCKQLKVEMAALIQPSSSKSSSQLIRRTSSSTRL
ncbi:bZIP transcription factor 27-like [Phragmites australis]|uniref:bZIP transcription factor 27-like n=1 Tax=Phragmites australis TaxID=29695 RepID=UPI002D796328|nr:bZIP transcription factor 27-like [Phragmites australis]